MTAAMTRAPPLRVRPLPCVLQIAATTSLRLLLYASALAWPRQQCLLQLRLASALLELLPLRVASVRRRVLTEGMVSAHVAELLSEQKHAKLRVSLSPRIAKILCNGGKKCKFCFAGLRPAPRWGPQGPQTPELRIYI